MHSKPLFQAALKLRAPPAPLEVFSASWTTSLLPAHSAQEGGGPALGQKGVQGPGDQRHGMCSSSSGGDGLSSIVQGHETRAKNPPVHPGFGGSGRGGNMGGIIACLPMSCNCGGFAAKAGLQADILL